MPNGLAANLLRTKQTKKKIYFKDRATIIFAPQLFIAFMKKIIGILTLALAFSSVMHAQDSEETKPAKKVIKPSRDFVMVQLTYENWSGTPDSVKVTGIGRGFNAYLCYDFPIAKSNFSVAAGIGVGTSNIYFDNQLLIMNTGAPAVAFKNVDTAAGTDLYKKSKLTTAYLEVPLELRFFGDRENRNKGFKAAVGVRIGMLIDAHTKNKNTVSGTTITEKVATKTYFQTWKFAPTARIGYGNFALFGSVNVTQLFNSGQGPSVYPYSIGLCITGL